MKNTKASYRSRHLFVVMLLAGASSVAAVVACSDDAEDRKSLCIRGCDKVVSCNPEAQGFLGACKNVCESPNQNGSKEKCTNESAIVAKYKECLAVSCEQFEACADSIPACQGGGNTGTGGSAGTGGTPGSGGMSGSGDCATVCAKADVCCKALTAAEITDSDPEDCVFATLCTSTAISAAQSIQTCQGVLTGGAVLLPDSAACK